TCPPGTASTPLTCGPACPSQMMNNPKCSTPACQCRPDRTHQRKNNAIPPAYDLVVSSEPSRPNRTCRKNASASPTTTKSSSNTAPYRTPDGNPTATVRPLPTPIS